MSKFLKVECDCGAEAIVFGNSSTVVNCSKCGNNLVTPTGGKTEVNCRIVEVLS